MGCVLSALTVVRRLAAVEASVASHDVAIDRYLVAVNNYHDMLDLLEDRVIYLEEVQAVAQYV